MTESLCNKGTLGSTVLNLKCCVPKKVYNFTFLSRISLLWCTFCSCPFMFIHRFLFKTVLYLLPQSHTGTITCPNYDITEVIYNSGTNQTSKIASRYTLNVSRTQKAQSTHLLGPAGMYFGSFSPVPPWQPSSPQNSNVSSCHHPRHHFYPANTCLRRRWNSLWCWSRVWLFEPCVFF